MVDSFHAEHGIPTASEARKVWSPLVGRTPLCASMKRTFDIVTAGAILMVFAWAFALIALAIVVESPGPVLFRQRRTGRHGRVFTIYKFRSMTVSEDGPAVTQAMRIDDRVTRIGAVIRRTSLDELPQLLNVIRGDMSLVGPRPHALAHDIHYGALLSRYPERFSVRPGLTGLAQVMGHRGETRLLDCMWRRVEADADYVARWSFAADLAILVRTIPILLSRTNAY